MIQTSLTSSRRPYEFAAEEGALKVMLTINIMKLEVNTISNVGSLNIGKSIVCYNHAVSTDISGGADTSPEGTTVTPILELPHIQDQQQSP